MSIENTVSERVVLVVAHAQHPLVDGVVPGVEFRARLDAAVAMGASVVAAEALSSVHYYVPGSQHHHDKLSLSAAGSEYLRRVGVTELIYGDEWNMKYGRDGVYNAADEALVASAGARALGTSAIISVISAGQFPRMRLQRCLWG